MKWAKLCEVVQVLEQLQVAEGGGAGPTINISAIDAKSIQRLFKNNGRAVASGLNSYARGFGKNGK